MLISPMNRPVYNFRGDLIKEIIAKGYSVTVTGPDLINVEKITDLGADFVEIPMKKTGTNIFSDLQYCYRLFKLIKKEKPDVTMGFTVKPVIYGAIAAKLAGVKHICSLIPGAGYTFTAKTFKAKVLGAIVRTLYRIAFKCANVVIFQNPDDKKEFCDLKLVKPDKCKLVSGSGVNLERFTPKPLPATASFLMISRLLICKGVLVYLKAADIIKKEFPDTKFYLLGKRYTEMQDVIPEDVFCDYVNRGIVEHFPETHDVRPYHEMSSVYVLPSYREGTPRTVLEAMAMGRPIITTDTNGCRETVKDGINGFLVPIGDEFELAEAMKKFILHPELIKQMGDEGIKYCTDKFDVKKVNKDMLNYLKIG